MKELIVNLLEDVQLRSEPALETLALQQTTAIPWET